MAKHFLQVTFKFADDTNKAKAAELKSVFNIASDWYKFSSTTWILWTEGSAKVWYERLRPHITDEDSMFIVKLDLSDRQGWLTKRMWDWLNEGKSQGS